MSVAETASDRGHYRPLLVMVAIAMVLTFWQHRAWQNGALSVPEYLAYRLTIPLATAFSTTFRKVHNVGVALGSAGRLMEENRQLREEYKELRNSLLSDVELRLEVKAMKEKLGLELGKPFDKVAAQVISRSSGRESRWVMIRTVNSKPIEVGNKVREAGGLVGRVVEVTEAGSTVGRVVLLVDPKHAVRAKVLPRGDEGMVHAAPELIAGPNRLRLEKVRRGAQIRVGDEVVTSDVGETYPGSIPIGVVESVRRSPVSVSNVTAYIKPKVDFEHLDLVYVLRAGEQ